MGDALQRDRILQSRPYVLLANEFGKGRRPIFACDDLIHAGAKNARPRVIRGTRTAPLPLLPSGPGGVCSRPLHGARDLTSIYRSMGSEKAREKGANAGA